MLKPWSFFAIDRCIFDRTVSSCWEILLSSPWFPNFFKMVSACLKTSVISCVKISISLSWTISSVSKFTMSRFVCSAANSRTANQSQSRQSRRARRPRKTHFWIESSQDHFQLAQYYRPRVGEECLSQPSTGHGYPATKRMESVRQEETRHGTRPRVRFQTIHLFRSDLEICSPWKRCEYPQNDGSDFWSPFFGVRSAVDSVSKDI
jgi:hypothetical protein